MRRVRHELALRPFTPLALGDVREHEHGELGLPTGRDPGDRIRALLVRRHTRLGDPGAGTEEAGCEPSERQLRPGLRKPLAGGQRGNHVRRRSIGELDVQLGVDCDHPLLQLVEEQPQAVSLGLEARERAPQAFAHPVDRRGELAELVAEPRSQLRLEAPALDLRGRARDPSQPHRDQNRDEKAGKRADQDRPQRRFDDRAAEDPQLGDEVGPRRGDDECRGSGRPQRKADDDRSAVVGAADEAAVAKRVLERLPVEVDRAELHRTRPGRRQERAVRREDEEREPTALREVVDHPGEPRLVLAPRDHARRRDGAAGRQLLGSAAKGIIRAFGEDLRHGQCGQGRDQREREREPPAHADSAKVHAASIATRRGDGARRAPV
jgi:hypothetical protein